MSICFGLETLVFKIDLLVLRNNKPRGGFVVLKIWQLFKWFVRTLTMAVELLFADKSIIEKSQLDSGMASTILLVTSEHSMSALC